MFAAKFQLLDDRVLVATGLLIGTLLLGALLLALIDRWRKRQMSDATHSSESLTSYRQLYENGELSQEEYDKIRARMAIKMRERGKSKESSQPSSPAPPAITQEFPLEDDD